MTDQYVYVHDKEHSWIPALLIDQDHKKDTATVSVRVYKNQEEITGVTTIDSQARTVNRKIKLRDYPHHALPLQNNVEGGHVADMIELSFLHEAAILYNLKARHVLQKPYTRTGDIVVAVNPYQWFPSLYSEPNRMQYSKALIFNAAKIDYDARRDLPPHVYETSALAYFGLSKWGEHQSILVSGESGAGKTETVKICMNHLASVVQQQETMEEAALPPSLDRTASMATPKKLERGTSVSSSAVGMISPKLERGSSVASSVVGMLSPTKEKETHQDDDVVKRVLDSNPLLEAFGNAKTRRNDNSSRFGKYILLQFSTCHNTKRLTLSGSTCQVYLLEKSRVVRHDDEERTFHIFYQLLAASDPVKGKFWDRLKNTSASHFKYVGKSDTKSIEGVSDEDRFQQTLDSLALIGIEGETLQTMIKAICVVLQLGNIVYTSGADVDQCAVKTKHDLADLADLMGIERSFFETTLTQRAVIVRNERHMVPIKADAAKEFTDALAKQIYDRIFLWLVRTINEATHAPGKSEDFGTIGLLDIFGFESFPVNSLEQLCINYANEQLQSKFTQDVFKSVFEEYKSEGIALEEISYDDNTEVLDLIQNSTGLLAMLNEECIRPNGSDAGFVNKALHANSDSPALIKPRIVVSKLQFGIRHYAGDVLYDATDFVTKNQDTLPADLMECARSSTNSIIANELKLEGVQPDRKSKKSSKSGKKRKASTIVAPTAWTKYKTQLHYLMTDLRRSQSRYIRCIKPNSLKLPLVMQHEMTLEQLRSSGVIAAVTLARSAFPNRLEHRAVLERFYTLYPIGVKRPNSKHLTSPEAFRAEAGRLMKLAMKDFKTKRPEDADKTPFVPGKTRMYFRAGALEYLEAVRLRGMEPAAICIQKMVRGYFGRVLAAKVKYAAGVKHLAEQEESIVMIQCAWRLSFAKAKLDFLRKEKAARDKRDREMRQKNAAAVVIQCRARVYMARKEKERRYVVHIKEKAKALKREKKLKKQSKAATVIQKYGRGIYVRSKYNSVLAKCKERAALREKLRKLKKKMAKSEKIRKKELQKIEEGVQSGMADREAWEENVKAATIEATKDETERMVEFLQGENRKLQLRNKTLDGMVKPLKKNFELLMEENAVLRKDFKEIHEKNEAMKKTNQELVDRRAQAEKKTLAVKRALKNISTKFMPIAHGRLDFQKALKEIMELLEKRCKDDQLYEDVTMMALQCQADAKGLQAGADAAKALELEQTEQRRAKRVGQSFRADPNSRTSFASPTMPKPKKKMEKNSVSDFVSPRHARQSLAITPGHSKTKNLKEMTSMKPPPL